MIPFNRMKKAFRIAFCTLSLLFGMATPSWALVSPHQPGGGGGGTAPSAPEIDPTVALSGITLAVGGFLVLADRRSA